MNEVLVTGSSGLIGAALSVALRGRGTQVLGVDLRGSADFQLDVRDIYRCNSKLNKVSGIIHLAAVSRVIEGERDPELCLSVNVQGTGTMLELASQLPLQPWFIFASSREVYGEQSELPVLEDTGPNPLNVYARSKVAAERLIDEARGSGLAACVLRFSSVYGSVRDHPDRVVPAFAAAAAKGGVLRVDCPDAVLDFTHVSDVVDGILGLVDLLDARRPAPPPIHLTTGVSTSLSDLAELAVLLGASNASIVRGTPRSYDVVRFWGDPSRASKILSWRPRIDVHTGLTHLVNEFKALHATGRRINDNVVG